MIAQYDSSFWVTVVLAGIGILLAGVALGKQLGVSRPRLTLSLGVVARLSPASAGVPEVQLRLGKRTLRDLWVLELRVRNASLSDYENHGTDADNPQSLFPRIEFPNGLRVVGKPFIRDGEREDLRCDVRAAAWLNEAKQQRLTVYPRRLARRGTVTLTIVCTDIAPHGRRNVGPSDFILVRGGLLHVAISGRELLASPQRVQAERVLDILSEYVSPIRWR